MTLSSLSDQELLLATAREASRFRNLVIAGDTQWIYENGPRHTPASDASRNLVDLLVECLKRELIEE